MHLKYLIPVILAAFAAPMYIAAQADDNPFAEPCLIRVFHTNFVMPQEGSLVEKNGATYFARTDIPGCENSANGLTPVGTNAPVEPNQVNTTNTQNGFVNFLLGDDCRVPVYHADFNFPPEGGVIIQTGENLFFVPTYLPSCASSYSQSEVIRQAGSPPVQVPPLNSGGGKVLTFLLGDSCMVPIYHTNFSMPSEGGEIIEKDGSLYYIKSYEPGCQSL